MKKLILLLITTSLFAIQEGTYVQYEEATKQTKEEDSRRASYQNPLLKNVKEPTEKQTLTLQQRITNYFGTFVTSSPYPGVRATFEGTELMSSLSSVNKDLQILLELYESNTYMKNKRLPYPKNPRVFLSGQIEFTSFVQSDALGHARSSLDLTNAEVDFLIVAAPWLYGFIAYEYGNSVDPAISNSRVQNSRIHADSLFLTFGNFTYEPWYGTIGQTYVPFGQYTTYNPVHDPLNKILFWTLAPRCYPRFFQRNPPVCRLCFQRR